MKSSSIKAPVADKSRTSLTKHSADQQQEQQKQQQQQQPPQQQLPDIKLPVKVFKGDKVCWSLQRWCNRLAPYQQHASDSTGKDVQEIDQVSGHHSSFGHAGGAPPAASHGDRPASRQGSRLC